MHILLHHPHLPIMLHLISLPLPPILVHFALRLTFFRMPSPTLAIFALSQTESREEASSRR